MASSSPDDLIQMSEALKSINQNINSSTKENINFKLIQAKITCLINLNKFSMAMYTIKMAKKYKGFPVSSFIFEEAYCYYRLSKFEHALNLIEEYKNETIFNCTGYEIIKAQILYRLERFSESAEIFQNLLNQNELSNQTEELKVNLLAAQAQAHMHIPDEVYISFESTYNASIAKFLVHDYKFSEKYSTDCAEIFSTKNEDLISSDLVNSKIVSISALAADKNYQNVYEAEALFKKLLAIENKSSLQSDIIKANLVFTAIRTGNLKTAPDFDIKKLDSINLFNYQKKQIRINAIQFKNEFKLKKLIKKSIVTSSLKNQKETKKKHRKNTESKKIDHERWLPLRDRTTYKPKSDYLKSLKLSAIKSVKSSIKKPRN